MIPSVRDYTRAEVVDRISFLTRPFAVQRKKEPLRRSACVPIEQTTRQGALSGAGQTHQHKELLLALVAPSKLVEERAAADERGDFDLLLGRLSTRGGLDAEWRIRSAEVEGGLGPAKRVPPTLAVDFAHFAQGSPGGPQALRGCSTGSEPPIQG